MGFPGSSVRKESACNAGDLIRFLGWEDPLEKEMATHFSILAWEIPWTEEPCGLHTTGSQRARHDLTTKQQILTYKGKSDIESAVKKFTF